MSVLIWITAVTAGWLFILDRQVQRRERFWQYEKISRRLIVAALLLMAAMTLARGGGYCRRSEGTYTAFMAGWLILLCSWACRIRLLFLLRKYQLSPPDNSCFECGYDLRGTLAAERTECPECGAKIPEGMRGAALK